MSRFFLLLSIMILASTSPSSSMDQSDLSEGTPSFQARTKPSDPDQGVFAEEKDYTINFLPNLFETKVAYSLLLFWTSGVKIQHCTPEGLRASLDIGGWKYAEDFRGFLKSWVKYPPAPFVSFVIDSRTEYGNPWLRELEHQYSGKLKIFLLEEAMEQIAQEVEKWSTPHLDQYHPTFPDKPPKTLEIIKSILANGDMGNPAIASDFFRLFFRGPCQETFSVSHRAYCDIDTFTEGLRTYPEALFQALFKCPTNFKIARKETANDIVSVRLGQSKENSWFDDFRIEIMEKWFFGFKYGEYFQRCCNYFLFRYEILQKVQTEKDFQTALTQLKKHYVPTWEIMNLTGPGSLISLRKWFDQSLSYPSVCALSWCQLNDLFKQQSLPFKTSELNEILLEYIKVMEYAVLAEKWGSDHPAFTSLVKYLENNNPFLTKAYKTSLREYVEYKISDNTFRLNLPEDLFKKEERDRIREDALKEDLSDNGLMEIYFTRLNAVRGEVNTYTWICKILESFGIKFELKPEDLMNFLRESRTENS